MTREEEFIDLQRRMLCVRIEMEGMIACNKFRESIGESIAYDETEFYALINTHCIGENDILSIIQND